MGGGIEEQLTLSSRAKLGGFPPCRAPSPRAPGRPGRELSTAPGVLKRLRRLLPRETERSAPHSSPSPNPSRGRVRPASRAAPRGANSGVVQPGPSDALRLHWESPSPASGWSRDPTLLFSPPPPPPYPSSWAGEE